MKKVILMLSSMMLAVCSCSDSDNGVIQGENEESTLTPRHDIVLSDAEKGVVAGQSDFSFDLLAEMLREENKNVVLSPWGIEGLLSMAANATEGEYLSEYLRVLGSANLAELNTLNKTINAELPVLDNQIELKLANLACINPEFTFTDNFTTSMIDFYKSRLEKIDLGTKAGVNVLNSWCYESTGGMVKTILEKPAPISLLLANANYFKGKWSTPFDKSKTRKGVFTGSDNRVSEVDMMVDETGVPVFNGDNFTMAFIDFGNRSFRFMALLPDNGHSVSDIASALDSDKWKNMTKKPNGRMRLVMPKFKIESAYDNIMNALSAIGLENVMNPKNQILTNMIMKNGDVVKNNFTSILHKAVIEIDEEGAKAASASAGIIATMPSPSKKELIFDKPFIFVIDEQSTGAILFIGAVNKL